MNCPPIEECCFCGVELGHMHHYCEKVCGDCENLAEEIKNILQWWDEQLCPWCGNEVHYDGDYHCGEWSDGAYDYCTICKFKNNIGYEGRLPDEVYLEAIREVFEK